VRSVVEDFVGGPVGSNEDLVNAGLGSLDAMSLVNTLTQQLGLEVPAGLLNDVPTIAGMVDLLDTMRGLPLEAPPLPEAVVTNGLRCLSAGNPTRGAARVYVIHGIDGDVFGEGLTFAALAPLLAPCRVSALTYDEEVRSNIESFHHMCTIYANRVTTDHDPEAPLVIIGYSFGCVIAHRVAGIGVEVDPSILCDSQRVSRNNIQL